MRISHWLKTKFTRKNGVRVKWFYKTPGVRIQGRDHFDLGVTTRGGFSEEGIWKIYFQVLPPFVNAGINLLQWEALPKLNFSLCNLGIS